MLPLRAGINVCFSARQLLVLVSQTKRITVLGFKIITVRPLDRLIMAAGLIVKLGPKWKQTSTHYTLTCIMQAAC